ncbi:MAG: S41 family peptidase, partial [Aquaticitalea sp.]
VPGSTTEVFGIVRLVLHNSVADNLGIKRGQVFKGISGTNLVNDIALLNNLLNQNDYSLNLADYNNNGTPQVDDDTIVPNNQIVDLNKEPYTENPVYISEVLQVNGENVGYLMYNAFNASFANELNEAFATFKASNVQDLVLDLRYNGGGRVDVAAFLGSMITGQFNDQVFSKLVYNSDQQSNNTNYNFTNSLGNGGSAINSLNLSRVYVLTSSRTASASEMIINSLKEYITVIQIGDTTVGKSQASTIIYDSPTLFSSANVNPNHTYAMLPLIAISVNKNDGRVPPTGLVPDNIFKVIESPRNLGVLGDPSEPLLARAIQHISGNGRLAETAFDNFITVKPFDDSQSLKNIMLAKPSDN